MQASPASVAAHQGSSSTRATDAGPDRQQPAGPAHQGSSSARQQGGPDRDRVGPMLGQIGSGQHGQRTRATAPPGQQGQRCRSVSRPAGQRTRGAAPPDNKASAAAVHRAAHRPANGQRAEPGRRRARSAAGSQGGRLSRTHYACARQASRPGSRQPCQPLARGNINRACARCPPKKIF